MPRISFLFLLFAPLALSLFTQGQDLSLRFVAQALPPDLGEIVMIAEERSSDPFELPMNNLTDGLKPPARAFSLIRSDGQGLPIARVSLPQEGTRFIVLLLVGGDDTPFSAVILPENDRFRAGDIYLHNTSDTQVFGKVGDVKVVLNASQGQIVRPSGAVDEIYYDVAFAVREAERTRYLTTSRWPVTDRKRSYVFFFKDLRNQRISFRAVDEFVTAGQTP
jgi:hypothetical protein